jgi:hypothetical protein
VRVSTKTQSVRSHVRPTFPTNFEEIRTGEKRFDIQKGGDNTYRVGDKLILREYDFSFVRDLSEVEAQIYSGRELVVTVTHVQSYGEGLVPGYCILSIEPPTD